jgi:hypothetical protein
LSCKTLQRTAERLAPFSLAETDELSRRVQLLDPLFPEK